ncbi:MAG TPA: type VII secretion-associated protein [Mycobacterium sp.]|nr:type VII secretion-associated protein [Mycobacterium sp.]
MTACVVEVGPATVRGPRAAPRQIITTALECIDDDIAIVGEAPVTVDALWREVFRGVLPDRCASALLVCPSWWPPTRVERVREAAATASANIAVAQRIDVLGTRALTIVEIAPDFVVVTDADNAVTAEPRLGATSEIARSVVSRIDRSAAVLVDAPADVVGAAELAGAISESLRAGGTAVTTVHPDRVLRVVEKHRTFREHPVDSPRSIRARPAVAVGIVLSLLVASLSVGLAVGADDPEPTSNPMTLLVEGQVALKVPALWSVRRITSGPGSARVEVTAPDGSTAVLMTQSQVDPRETLATAAASLRAALADQDAGVFVGFDADDRRADRPVITYREVRGARQTDWTVLVDDTVRIAVGCQSPSGDEDAVRAVCDEAVRSAHAIF